MRGSMTGTSFYKRLLAIMVALFIASLSPIQAYAQKVEPVCTNFEDLASKINDKSPGIMTDITNFLKKIIGDATQKLYQAFTDSDIYQSAVAAAVTLSVTIYGVSFLIGVTQASFGQVFSRLVKFGLIFSLISPAGWDFFSNYAVKFFNDGTDQLIGGVMEIGTGMPYTPGSSPFLQLDGLARFILSPDMVIAIIGSTTASGPYGLGMGFLLAFAVGGVLKMLIDALKTYGLSFLVRSLLLGVAPVFIVFLLFDKTRGIFTGWLNAMINLSLQPILYFTFISFFITMLTTASTDMLGDNELCWTEYTNVQGSQNKRSGWRFKVKDANAPDVDSWDWNGSISCRLEGKSDCPAFPINVVDILSFLILIYVAQRFSGVVERIAAEISNSAVSLDKNTRMEVDKDQKGVNENAGKAEPQPPAAKGNPQLGTTRKTP